MYTIGNIIYGFPFQQKSKKYPYYVEKDISTFEDILSDELFKLIDAAKVTTGFLSYYTGSGDNEPKAFGIQIDDFDETLGYLDASWFENIFKVKQETIDKYNELWNNLTPEIKAEITKLGFDVTPRVFVLWSTS